jgi:hypothetical protein
MRQKFSSIINLFDPTENLSLSLFNSEGFYWLTSATAIAFAAEELVKYQEKFPHFFSEPINILRSEALIKLFHESVKSGEPSEAAKKEAQDTALYNLDILASFAKKSIVFEPAAGLILGKTFATYWLIYKLIELEWQQILNLDEKNETYLLLDTVIDDHKELENMEQHCLKEDLSKDDKLYLQSHWERVRYFWINLQEDLQLLASGFIKFRPPVKEE